MGPTPSEVTPREQVDDGHLRRVVAKESEPSLRRGGRSPNHLLRHARLSDLETELKAPKHMRASPRHSTINTSEFEFRQRQALVRPTRWRLVAPHRALCPSERCGRQ
jgi:hypothetical protein